MTRSDRSIAGKVALITGGGRGLGAATVRSLTAAGARVFVIDLHPRLRTRRSTSGSPTW